MTFIVESSSAVKHRVVVHVQSQRKEREGLLVVCGWPGFTGFDCLIVLPDLRIVLALQIIANEI